MYYYQFHIGDYRSATSHLSNEEDLAYRRLLDMYYDTEKPIPLDVAWVSKRIKIAPMIVRDVLNDMFKQTEDGFIHSRCDKEIAVYKGFSTAGKLGAAIRWGKRGDSPSITPPIATMNHEPTTNNHKPIKEGTRGSRLSVDWVLPTEWADWAKQERPDLDLKSVSEQFRDYWSAKAGSGATKLDWQATWRNWVRNQKQVFKQADIIRTTVPSSSQRDPALQKLDEDMKNAKANPEILKMIREGFGSKLT